MIDWKYSSPKRCAIVANRFQSNFEAGRLQYIVPGTNSGNEVVCASEIQKNDDNCDDERVLMYVQPGEAQTIVNEIGNYMEQRTRDPGKHSSPFMVRTEDGNFVIDLEYALRSLKSTDE